MAQRLEEETDAPRLHRAAARLEGRVGVETLDHPSDRELLAYARKLGIARVLRWTGAAFEEMGG